MRLRFDNDSLFVFHSTAIRPRNDHSTTYVTTGLLHCGQNKDVGQRDCDYVTVILMTFRKQSNGRRIEIELKSNRRCNYRISRNPLKNVIFV